MTDRLRALSQQWKERDSMRLDTDNADELDVEIARMEAEPPIDIIDKLHDIMTRYGIASRSLKDGREHLVTELITWAADACRQSRLASPPTPDGAPRLEGWQPIETAPRNVTEVLLTDGHYKRTGWWARRIEQWSIDAAVPLAKPTHWMPLPLLTDAEPPKESHRG